MKKSLIAVLLLLFCAVSAIAEEKKEMVVLFDTSVSVLPYFDFLSGRLIHDLVNEHLDEGDNFHLLSFDAEPHFEFSLSMMGSSEEERIISYTSLLKPMGQHTDLISALNFLYRFTMDLPLNSAKKILILTDGIHDPPPTSPLYGKSSDYIREMIEEITGKIYRQGWSVHILELPTGENSGNLIASTEVKESSESTVDETKPTGTTENSVTTQSEENEDEEKNQESAAPSQGENVIEVLSEELDTPAVPLNEASSEISNLAMGNINLEILAFQKESGYRFDLPISLQNYGTNEVYTGINEVIWNGQNILTKKISGKIESSGRSNHTLHLRIPSETEPGEIEMELRFIFADGADITPNSALIKLLLTDEIEDRYRSEFPWPLIIGIIFILIFIVLVIIFIRHRIESPTVSREEEKDAEPGSVVLPITDSKTDESDSDKKIAPSAASDPSSERGRKKGPRGEKPIPASPELNPPSASSVPESSGSPSSQKALYPTKKTETQVADQTTVRKNEEKQSSRAAAVVGKEKVSSIEKSIKEEEEHLALEMHVVGQNPYKWSRNIEVLKPDSKLIVGNRHDDLSIFIIDIPRHCAELSFDGKIYTLRPIITEHFPELKGPVKNCLDRYIKVVDGQGKQTRIVFRKWVSPLKKINRIMHMIDKPGRPDFRY